MTPGVILDHQRDILLRLVAALFAVVGLEMEGSGGRGPGRLTRYLRSKVLVVLQPAESATRRLVVALKLLRAVRYRGVLSRTARALPVGGIPQGTGERMPAFRLTDPRKRFDLGLPRRTAPKAPGHGPRITVFGFGPIVREAVAGPVEPVAASPEDPLDAAQICRRLRALKSALDDLPKQARRLARAEAREAAKPTNTPDGPYRRVKPTPMRPGLPPGYRQRRRHPVDDVLLECHTLALRMIAAPDTS